MAKQNSGGGFRVQQGLSQPGRHNGTDNGALLKSGLSNQ